MESKEEFLRRVREAENEAKRHEELKKASEPFNYRGMRSRTPLGCWMWVLFGLWGIGYLILRALKD